MKKKLLAVLMIIGTMLSMASCSIPLVGDFFESENSLGKTNNTAVSIAGAMKDYLKNKNKEDHALYGIEMILNSDSNGMVKLYYSAAAASEAEYSDIRVAEVDSKTGHVERFGKANYAKDGLLPYQLVKESDPFDGGSLPIDSGKAISAAVRAFSGNTDFHYDYVQICLSAPSGLEQYEIEFISMLNETVYYCTVDAVSGAVLASSTGSLE